MWCIECWLLHIKINVQGGHFWLSTWLSFWERSSYYCTLNIIIWIIYCRWHNNTNKVQIFFKYVDKKKCFCGWTIENISREVKIWALCLTINKNKHYFILLLDNWFWIFWKIWKYFCLVLFARCGLFLFLIFLVFYSLSSFLA